MLHCPVLHLEEHLADLGRVVGITRVHRASHHATDDAVLVDLAGLHGQCFHCLTVTNDRDGVSDLLDLVEFVRDHDAGHALGLEPAQ